MRYFVERNPNYGACLRYHILNGSTVIAITVSRPDGEEVLPPSGVRWKMKEPDHSAHDVSVKRAEFHNVSVDVADAARKRAGEAHKKRIKWNGGKR